MIVNLYMYIILLLLLTIIVLGMLLIIEALIVKLKEGRLVEWIRTSHFFQELMKRKQEHAPKES